MNEMGGSLAAKSEGVGKGATFIITLPLTKK
ncbi:MAG: signal transduction histidine kinase [bacterium]|jgi:signal transduction histidine kinase